MDFFKSCTTGVQTLPGFNSILYHVYSVERKDESREEREEVSLEDILVSLASQLRARTYLTWTDSNRRALWIFRGGNNTGFADGPLDEGFAEPVRGIALKCEVRCLQTHGMILIPLLQHSSKAPSRPLNCRNASPDPPSQTHKPPQHLPPPPLPLPH
jgi:hypothetical protein